MGDLNVSLSHKVSTGEYHYNETSASVNIPVVLFGKFGGVMDLITGSDKEDGSKEKKKKKKDKKMSTSEETLSATALFCLASSIVLSALGSGGGKR